MSDRTVREYLRDQHAQLLTLNPYPWDSVTEWASQTRVYFVDEFPAHVDEFDRRTVPPKWQQSVSWSIGDAGGSTKRETAAENLRRAGAARDRLAAFLDAVLKLPVRSPATSSTGNTTIVIGGNSRVGAVAVGDRAKAVAKRRKG